MIRLKSETSEVAMNYDNLPDEMRTLPNWACYRTYTNKEGKRKKVIISPQNGNFAKSNEPNTWTDFETAKNHLTDIAGIRIICYFEADVYHVAEQLKKYTDMICMRESDYIANPKPNGYKSYHIILGVPVYHTDSKEYYPVEVQIRSLTMDLWASMEHRIIYKSPNVDIEKSREVFLKFANELKECENQLFDLKEENNKMGGER